MSIYSEGGLEKFCKIPRQTVSNFPIIVERSFSAVVHKGIIEKTNEIRSENDETKTVYDKKIGNTVYTVVVKPSVTAKTNIFDITKRIIESYVEDMLSVKYNELAECFQKE